MSLVPRYSHVFLVPIQVSLMRTSKQNQNSENWIWCDLSNATGWYNSGAPFTENKVQRAHLAARPGTAIPLPPLHHRSNGSEPACPHLQVGELRLPCSCSLSIMGCVSSWRMNYFWWEGFPTSHTQCLLLLTSSIGMVRLSQLMNRYCYIIK